MTREHQAARHHRQTRRGEPNCLIHTHTQLFKDVLCVRDSDYLCQLEEKGHLESDQFD